MLFHHYMLHCGRGGVCSQYREGEKVLFLHRSRGEYTVNTGN